MFHSFIKTGPLSGWAELSWIVKSSLLSLSLQFVDNLEDPKEAENKDTQSRLVSRIFLSLFI